jgi:uncharacterized repeat protein (TIGR03803 family)
MIKYLRSTILIILVLNSYILDAQSLYGINANGGQGAGLIYKLDGSGNLIDSIPFPKIGGDTPGYTSLTEDLVTGKMYGVTTKGGIYDFGIIYEYDPLNDKYVVVHEFNGMDGAIPNGALSYYNGKFYGMTFSGGTYSGVLYEFDPITNNYTKKIDLTETTGYSPYGSLIVAKNGLFYGMTSAGGQNKTGVIFEYNLLNNDYKIKYSFESNGGQPYGSLLQASNDKLYGFTNKDVSSNLHGSLFEYDVVNNTFNVLNNNLYNPYGSLIQSSNGKLYGLTFDANVIEYDLNKTKLSSYPLLGGPVNYTTKGALLETSNGNLYFLSYTSDSKTYLYSFNIINKTFSRLVDLTINYYSKISIGSLIENTRNNKIYGVTSGGNRQKGVLFEYDYQNNISKKIVDFSDDPLGSSPQPRLLNGRNGKLYGTTLYGGLYNSGVLFEFDTLTKKISKKFDFGDLNGFNANGVIIARNGKLYGTTKSGGQYTLGVLYEFDISNNIFSKLHDFINGSGSSTYSSLIQADNNKLYGYGLGGVFEYDYANQVFILKPNTSKVGILYLNYNGKLYSINKSSIIEYDPNYNSYNSYSISLSSTPNGLMIASNGNFYTTTSVGGINNLGAIFEFNQITKKITKLLDFNIINGSYPIGILSQSSNGKLYGFTKEGGAKNLGIIFEFDYISKFLTKKHEFSDEFGYSYFNVIDYSLPQLTLGSLDAFLKINGKPIACENTNLELSTNFGDGLNYQWINTGKNIIGANTNKYYPITTGKYSVKIFNTYSDSSISNEISVTINPLPEVKVTSNGPTTYCTTKLTELVASNGVSYLWNDGSTNKTIKPTQSGSYFVKLTDINGCSASSEPVYLTVNDCASLDKISDKNVLLYPNPIIDILTVELPAQYVNSKFKVIDVSGKELVKGNLYTTMNTINLESLTSGTYFLEIGNEYKTKFIKQ